MCHILKIDTICGTISIFHKIIKHHSQAVKIMQKAAIKMTHGTNISSNIPQGVKASSVM
jgi:hypothetical protein